MRTFFPIHEFDNAFGGTKMIAGEIGTVVNAGNRDETGSFWTLQPCPAAGPGRGAGQRAAPPARWRRWSTARSPRCCTAAPLPVYGDGPQCNTRGITPISVPT